MDIKFNVVTSFCVLWRPIPCSDTFHQDDVIPTHALPTDNFMRQHKQSGAWMSDYRAQSRTGSEDGSSVVPIIVNNNNFAKGSEVRRALKEIKRIISDSSQQQLFICTFLLHY